MARAILPTLQTPDSAVLCAIDFSDRSRRALRYAARVGATLRLRLVVIYIDDPLLKAALGKAYPSAERKARRELLAFVRRTLPRQAWSVEQCLIRTGKASVEILRGAAEHGRH